MAVKVGAFLRFILNIRAVRSIFPSYTTM